MSEAPAIASTTQSASSAPEAQNRTYVTKQGTRKAAPPEHKSRILLPHTAGAGPAALPLTDDAKVRLQRVQSFLERRGVGSETLGLALKVLEEDEAEQQNLKAMSRAHQISADEYVSQRQQSAMQTNAELRELLGPEVGDQVVEYRNSFPFIPIAQQFAARCDSAGMPLSDDAVGNIAVILSKYNVTAPSSASPRAVEELRAANDPKAFARASAILTPAQFEAFKKFWTEHAW